jgi:hypothetical protein
MPVLRSPWPAEASDTGARNAGLRCVSISPLMRARPRIGPPPNDTRPAAARQPKGEYQSVPDTVVDHWPLVSQKPITALSQLSRRNPLHLPAEWQ